MSVIPAKSTAQRAHILALLRERGSVGITNIELNQLCALRYTARISELRKMGWVIQTRRESESIFKFVLISEPTRPKPLPTYGPRAADPQIGRAHV